MIASDYIIQIAGLALGASAAVSGIVTLLTYRREKRLRSKAPSLEDKINSLTENLNNSLSVISEVESEIEKRSKIADRLKDDVKHYETLKELNAAQVEAIVQTIRGEITGESRKTIWRNAIITFIVALIFFFLGFWLRGA